MKLDWSICNATTAGNETGNPRRSCWWSHGQPASSPCDGCRQRLDRFRAYDSRRMHALKTAYNTRAVRRQATRSKTDVWGF